MDDLCEFLAYFQYAYSSGLQIKETEIRTLFVQPKRSAGWRLDHPIPVLGRSGRAGCQRFLGR